MPAEISTTDWLNGGPCIYCGKDHLSQFCHVIDDDEVLQAPPQITAVDTWWSALRWRVALAIVGRAMWIAPDGTVRDRWGDYQRAWSGECRKAWDQRYPENNRDGNSTYV